VSRAILPEQLSSGAWCDFLLEGLHGARNIHLDSHTNIIVTNAKLQALAYTTPPAGRRQSLQEVFADEIADEARGLEKMNRQANEIPLDSGTATIQ
jgi:hypothetical protein